MSFKKKLKSQSETSKCRPTLQGGEKTRTACAPRYRMNRISKNEIKYLKKEDIHHKQKIRIYYEAEKYGTE